MIKPSIHKPKEHDWAKYKEKIPPFALDIIKKLNRYDFEAYLVGGCIRDILLDINPKDFDIATDAHPEQITAIFKNSRIIGRRFKIVHVRNQKEIIEVSTFRKKPEEVSKLRNGVIQDNTYGTIDEDAERRDFTINAIFFDPINNLFIDAFNGVDDIKKKNINFIGDPKKRIIEDPIRLLRAIRFHSKLNFSLPLTKLKIHSYLELVDKIPESRLFDEMMKFFLTGHASKSIKILKKFDLISIFFPHLKNHDLQSKSLLMLGMKNTDERVTINKTVNPGFLMAVLLWDSFIKHAVTKSDKSLDWKINTFFNQLNSGVFINKRFMKYVSDIWRMQPRFLKIKPKSVYRLSNHPRFRAGYDFLLLRSMAGEEKDEIADWWTKWQSSNDSVREKLLNKNNL